MYNTLTILTTAFLLLNALIVHATPASPLPVQLITSGSAAPNLTAPGQPFVYEQCTGHPPAQPAPLVDCLRALSQFPTSDEDGEFHSPIPHDPHGNYSLGQVRKSGQCRIFVDLLRSEAGGLLTPVPTVWSWGGEAGLVNTARSLLEKCTADQSVPVQQQVTGGVSILSILLTISSGFKITVIKTAEVPLEGEGVDVT